MKNANKSCLTVVDQSTASDDGELDQFKPGNHQSALGVIQELEKGEAHREEFMYVPTGLTMPTAKLATLWGVGWGPTASPQSPESLNKTRAKHF